MEIEYIFNNEKLTAEIKKVSGAQGDVVLETTVERDGKTYDVTGIGNSAFKGSNITSVTIPEGVERIDGEVFGGCKRLKTVKIPSTVTYIVIESSRYCIGTFSDTPSLQEINVAEDNIDYASEDGVLYNADKTTLLYCPRGKKGPVAVAEGVVNIKERAFSGCHKITDVSLPDPVTVIGVLAFQGSSLRSINIPKGCDFDECVFYGCDKLTKIALPLTPGRNGLSIEPTNKGWTIKPSN